MTPLVLVTLIQDTDSGLEHGTESGVLASDVVSPFSLEKQRTQKRLNPNMSDTSGWPRLGMKSHPIGGEPDQPPSGLWRQPGGVGAAGA